VVVELEPRSSANAFAGNEDLLLIEGQAVEHLDDLSSRVVRRLEHDASPCPGEVDEEPRRGGRCGRRPGGADVGAEVREVQHRGLSEHSARRPIRGRALERAGDRARELLPVAEAAAAVRTGEDESEDRGDKCHIALRRLPSTLPLPVIPSP